MNKKTERILLGVVVVVLVLYGIYQVAYGTNESSYRYGYHAAFDNYKCMVFQFKTHDDCQTPTGDEATDICVVGFDNITNSTACIDGYQHGWEHYCTTYTKACTDDIKYGLYPGSPGEHMKAG